jgi:hypothetical protein
MPEPSSPSFLIPLVDELLNNEAFSKSFDIRWLQEAMSVTADNISALASCTKGQSSNPMWCVYRKLRFTASKFGDILRSARYQRFVLFSFKDINLLSFVNFLTYSHILLYRMSSSLFRSLTEDSNLSHVAAIKWGVTHESTAIQAYCNFGALVNPTGSHHF